MKPNPVKKSKSEHEDELDYALSKWKRLPVPKTVDSNVLITQAWAVVMESGKRFLLHTDQEACIYLNYATALKNKGCHKIVSVLITEIPLKSVVKKGKV